MTSVYEDKENVQKLAERVSRIEDAIRRVNMQLDALFDELEDAREDLRKTGVKTRIIAPNQTPIMVVQ